MRVYDGGVLVAVLRLQRHRDAFLDTFHPHNRDHRHHLLLLNERVHRVRFSEKQLCTRWQIDSCRLRQEARILADEILVSVSLRTTAALPLLDGESRLGKTCELCSVEFHGGVLSQPLHQLVRHAFEHEHLFLADTEEIVIKRSTRNNRFRRTRRTARVVDEHGRIARAGADGALAGLHRGFDDHRAARHEQQTHVLIFAERIEGIERRLLDDAGDVLDSRLAIDRFIVSAHRYRGTFGRAWMRVEHHGIACRDDVHDVAAQRGNRMRAGRDRADDTERRVFLERDAVIATASVRAQPIHPRHELDQTEFGYLVVEATNLRLFKFNSTPSFRVLFGHRLDDLLDLATGRHASALKLHECFLRC